MSTNLSETNSAADYAKWGVVAALLIASIWGFYHFSELATFIRVLGVMVGFGLAAFVAVSTSAGAAAWVFVKDSRNEVRKVVWPTRQETLQTTLAVVVMVIVTGLMLWLLDMFLLWAVKALTGQ